MFASWICCCGSEDYIHVGHTTHQLTKKATQPKWKPDDLKELLDKCGSLRVAIIPAARAHNEAKTNAGIFPPPNSASH